MVKQTVLFTSEELVYEYFRLITKKDVQGLVNLFVNDCTIYEPFSKLDGLHGKAAIEHFFKVAVMANAGMNRNIRFVNNNKEQDSIVVLVTFEKGDSVTGRFEFHFVRNESGRKIRTLRIEFLVT
ncbi:MAG: nuclear transport factor 2 family protein [Nitrososphaera sp.]|jgi:ketosteroid isomerase-like protein